MKQQLSCLWLMLAGGVWLLKHGQIGGMCRLLQRSNCRILRSSSFDQQLYSPAATPTPAASAFDKGRSCLGNQMSVLYRLQCAYLGCIVEDRCGAALVPAGHHNLLQGLALQVSAGNLLVHVVNIGTVVLACPHMQHASREDRRQQMSVWSTSDVHFLLPMSQRIGAM